MRLTAIIAALGLCAVLAVTASAQNSPPTKQSGKLIVGFDLPAPGFWNGRVTGTTIKNPSGFEYSLALAIAKQLGIGRRTSSSCGRRSGRSCSPGKKKFDFALEETTITAQRAKVIGFSTPYFDANQGVLDPEGPPEAESISRPQVAPDVRAGRDDRPRLHPAQAPPDEEAARLLGVVERRVRRGRGGRCDALILDVPIVVSQSKKKPGAYGGVIGQIVTRRGLRRGHGEGQRAEAVRRPRDQGAQGERDDHKLQKKWLPFTRVPVLK